MTRNIAKKYADYTTDELSVEEAFQLRKDPKIICTWQEVAVLDIDNPRRLPANHGAAVQQGTR